MFKFNRLSLGLAFVLSNIAYAATGMVSLTDQEMSEAEGQALMSLSYISPSDSANLMSKYSSGSNVGFYKLGLEAEIELNANIKNLQLGCGGINGAGACDVDIKNLSLSGLNTGSVSSGSNAGSPTFSNGRPSTSAVLTNPFAEFAIKNPNSAALREMVGMRFSAESIKGLLTAGLDNLASPTTTDGIQSLSGFMRLASTTGEVTTAAGTFGKSASEILRGNVRIIGLIDTTFASLPLDPITTGITVPSMTVGFTTPAFQVNGNRRNTADISGINVAIPNIALDTNPADLLRVQLNPTVLGVEYSRIRLKEGSKINNLNLSVTFNQSLSMIHNIPLEGTGGYLALQSTNLLWPGSYIDASDTAKTNLSQMTKSDVAQAGWWMSFAEPVNLGYLKGTNAVDISAVYPQIATLINTELAKDSQRINLGLTEAFQALTNSVITTPEALVVNLNNATNPNLGGTPATILLQNIQLTNQAVSANCWGNLKFC